MSALQVRLPFLGIKTSRQLVEFPPEELKPTAWEWVVPVLAGMPAESGRGIQAEEKF